MSPDETGGQHRGVEKGACMRCGATSDQRVLIPCLQRGEEKWICASCLPYVIHGEG